MNGRSFEYTGFVESLNIKGGGPEASHQVLFSLVSQNGKEHWPFRLDTSAPARCQTMTSLLAAAYAAGAVVQLNTAPGTATVPFAAELEVRRG